MCYGENKSLFFDVMKNGKIFLENLVIFNMITDSFSVEKQEILESGMSSKTY